MDTIRYLEMVVEWESQLYMQKMLRNKLTSEMEQLGRPKYFEIPERRMYTGKRKNTELDPMGWVGDIFFDLGELIKWVFIRLLISIGIGVGISLLLCSVFAIAIVETGLYEKWFGTSDPGIDGFVIIMLSTIILVFFGQVIIKSKEKISYTISDIKKRKDTNPKAMQKAYDKEYQQNLKQYNKNKEIDEERVERELIRKKILLTEIEKLEKVIMDTNNKLNKIYSTNILYPKYRNFIAAGTILDYMKSRRCYQLEGPNGAYNLFESESRQDLIITKLDNIIAALDRISNTQYVLYSAISQSNHKLEQLYDSTQQMITRIDSTNKNLQDISTNINLITQNTAISAYCTEQMAKDIHYDLIWNK